MTQTGHFIRTTLGALETTWPVWECSFQRNVISSDWKVFCKIIYIIFRSFTISPHFSDAAQSHLVSTEYTDTTPSARISHETLNAVRMSWQTLDRGMQLEWPHKCVVVPPLLSVVRHDGDTKAPENFTSILVSFTHFFISNSPAWRWKSRL